MDASKNNKSNNKKQVQKKSDKSQNHLHDSVQGKAKSPIHNNVKSPIHNHANKEMKEVKKPTNQKTSQEKKEVSKPIKKVVNSNKASNKKKPNLLLWISGAIAIVPCVILAWVILGTKENSNEPVVGDRFDHFLDPAITQQDIQTLKDELVFEQADKVEVNLKSATLRIMIDGKDGSSKAQLEEMRNQAYDIVIAKLPVETYFTNKKKDDKVMKMYDLEISAYNFIPENEEQKQNAIHVNRVKNASAEEMVDQVLTEPKDKETSNDLLHPDTSTPPSKAK